MTPTEMKRASEIRKTIQALQNAQWARFSFAVSAKITELKTELNTLVSYK